MDVTELPFNRYIGLTSFQVDELPAVGLTPQDHHLNHVGTLHATVLYGLAEAASGQCLIDQRPELIDSGIAVVRTSSVKYRAPGDAKLPCEAVGTVAAAELERLSVQLARRGKSTVDVMVSVRQQERELLTGTFTWFVRRNES